MMGKKSNGQRSIIRAAAQHGGARSTHALKLAVGNDLLGWLHDSGETVRRVREVDASQVGRYLRWRADPGVVKDGRRKRKGCNEAALANILSLIRVLIRTDGGNPDAAGITRKNLEIKSRARVGVKMPIGLQQFEDIVQEARRRGWEGLALSLELERYLGLRALESMCCASALAEFARRIGRAMAEARRREQREGSAGKPFVENNLRDVALRVVDGTKGGRTRETWLLHTHIQTTWRVISESLEYAASHGGHLIQGPGKNLKSARSMYHRQCRELGLIGKLAPHAMRYRYAVDLMGELQSRGWTRTEILARTAQALGHGTSRHRWIKSVYGATMMSQLPPPEKRTNALARLAWEVEELAQGILRSDGT